MVWLMFERILQRSQAAFHGEVPVRFGPGHFELKHLYLVEIHHVGKGSLWPVFGYYPDSIPDSIKVSNMQVGDEGDLLSPYTLSPLFRM